MSNNVLKNHHVKISQLFSGNIRTQETKTSVTRGSFLFHSPSLETSVCVYSRSMTSSLQSQTAPSDSIPAEVLTEAVAEVNLEHTCDYVRLCYPAVPTSRLIYGPHVTAVHNVSSLTSGISRKWRRLTLPAFLSVLTVFIKFCVGLCVAWSGIRCYNSWILLVTPPLHDRTVFFSHPLMLLFWVNSDSPLKSWNSTSRGLGSHVLRLLFSCSLF